MRSRAAGESCSTTWVRKLKNCFSVSRCWYAFCPHWPNPMRTKSFWRWRSSSASAWRRASLRALNLVGRERTQPVALREDGSADRLPVRHQRQRQQRAHAEGARISRAHQGAGSRVFDDNRLAAVQHLEQEGWLGALAVLAPPQVLLLACRLAAPALAILLSHPDLPPAHIDPPP